MKKLWQRKFAPLSRSRRFGMILFFILMLGNFSKIYAASRTADGPAERIVVFTETERGAVNKLIFGNNLAGYDPMTYENWAEFYYGYSDFGIGIWDPEQRKPVTEVVKCMKETGVSAVRFPGGCGTHHYDWKVAIGEGRAHFRFGIGEFLRVARELNAEPILTVSYFTGDEKDAADLVEYLNVPNDGRNPNGGTDWAAERAKNGHAEPQQVKYFEIGNEVWHGDHQTVKSVSAKTYAERYLKYYDAMKAIDPEIQIGALLNESGWDEQVMTVVKNKLDFGIYHFYLSAGWAQKDLAGRNMKKIFYDTINEPGLYYEQRLQKKLKLMREAAGREVPLAITEYNTAFFQDEPFPPRHALGAALVNAEILRIIMKPENKIVMANYWDAISRFWGLINNFKPVKQENIYLPYVKRPNYFVYEFYHKHFGPILLEAKAQGSGSYLSVNSSKSADGKKVYLIVINKNMDEDVGASIKLMDFSPAPAGEAWILNGPSVESTNEVNHQEVKVTHQSFDVAGQIFRFTFAPHSLTALELSQR